MTDNRYPLTLGAITIASEADDGYCYTVTLPDGQIREVAEGQDEYWAIARVLDNDEGRFTSIAPPIDPVAILIAKEVAKSRTSGVLDAGTLAKDVRALLAEAEPQPTPDWRAAYCTSCDHPHGYHGEQGCSMPLNAAGHPVSRNESTVRACGCLGERNPHLPEPPAQPQPEPEGERHESYYSTPGGHAGRREDCKICPPLVPVPSPVAAEERWCWVCSERIREDQAVVWTNRGTVPNHAFHSEVGGER